MGRILLRSLGPVWPLGLLALAGAGVLRALNWPTEAFLVALAAAVLALLATPITLLPGARLLAELRRLDPARAPGGSLWPGLSWALRAPPAPVVVPAATEDSAAQMSAALRAVASEIALMKRQGTEMRRSFTEAVEAGHRMATAAETAGLWFDDTARRSTEAAAALGQLQAMAAAQATSLGTLTDHAGQALALLSDAAPGKAWLEDVMARVPELPAQLDAALDRVEAGAAALAEAGALPERMVEQVAALETAGTRLQLMTGELPEQVANLSAVAQQFEAVAALPERFAAALAQGEVQMATQLEAVAMLPGRFETAMALAEAQGGGLAAQAEAMLTQTEAQMATLRQTAEQLAETPQRFEAAMTRAAGHAAELGEMARLSTAMAEVPARLDAVLARGEAQASGLAGVAEQLGSLAGVAARFDAPMAQLGRTAERLDAAAGRMPEEVTAALERAAAMADAGQARLDQGLAHLADSETRLQAATATLEVTATRLGEALPQAVTQVVTQAVACQLEGIAAPMHRAIAGLTEAGEALAPMAAGMAGLVQQIPRLEAAIDRAAEAPQRTAEQLTAVTGAIEAMVRQARPSPGRSVSARILGQLDAEAEPAVTATLLRLDGVETEVEQLLRRAETLVEGPGGAAPVSPGLARHAPELLEGLDATIRQLQSVATAIAVAADRGSRRVAARA